MKASLFSRYKQIDPEPRPAWMATERQMPDLSPKSGKQNGLQVVIDMKAYKNQIASVTQEYYGLQVRFTFQNGTKS